MSQSHISRMNHAIVLAIVVCVFVPDTQGSYNKVLHFPEDATVSDYVTIEPNLREAQEAISVCAWIKKSSSESHMGIWLSYAVAASSWEMALSDKGGQQYFRV